MTPDDETLMAYADGQLDLLSGKRVERAMAADPAVAAAVEAHRTLSAQLNTAFGPVIEEPVPARLTAMLQRNVTALMPLPVSAAPPRRVLGGLALAASLLVGIALGTQWQGPAGPVSSAGGRLIAAGDLAKALDTQLASAGGETRILASFRDTDGVYCRVFGNPALEGVACRTRDGWTLRQTRAAAASQNTTYRQAASADAGLLAAAQDMMAGEPLDPAGEKRAVANGWR